MDDVMNQQKADAERNDLLIWACARGLVGDAKELVKQGAQTMTKDKKGLRPMHYCASHGHVELAEFLAAHGADIDGEDPQGRTPLHYAAAGGCYAMVQFLATKLAWLDGYDAQDDTALHLAARRGDLKTVKLLCEKGAKVNLANKRGLSPLGEALVGGHVPVAEALLAAGAHTSVTARGFTLLHLVCGLGLSTCAALLLGPKAKADPNEASNSEGLTPLHAAAMAGSLECVELLLKHGANAAAKSAEGLLASELVPEPDASSTLDAAAVRQASARRAEVVAALEAAATKAGAKVQKGAKAVKAPAGAKAKESLPETATFEQRFAALAKDEQMHRVSKYTDMEEASWPSDLPEDAKTQIRELRTAIQLLNCIKAIAALRNDEDFQSDMVNSDVKAALETIKKTNDPLRFKDNAGVQNVMTKMNRLQAVLKQNSNPQITLDDLLVTPTGPRSLKETAQKVKNMEGMVGEMRQQAVRLMMGLGKEEAKAKAEAKTSTAKAGGEAGTKEAPKGMEAERSSQAKPTGKEEKTTKSQSEAKPAAKKKSEIEEEVLAADEKKAKDKKENELPPLGFPFGGDRPLPTTWSGWVKEFGYELGKQLMHSLTMMVCSIVIMWALGMTPQWLKGMRSTTTDIPAEELAAAAEAVKASLKNLHLDGFDGNGGAAE